MLTATATRLNFYMNAPAAIRASRYVFIVIRWIFVVVIVFAVTKSVCEYVINHVLPQVYSAKATLQIPASDLVVPTAGSSPEPVAFQPEYENTIRSPDFLLSVIKDLDLEQAWAKRLYKSDDQLPDVDALTHMEDVLKFRTEPEANTISIAASSDVPQEAANIANAVADRYKTVRNTEEEYSRTGQAFRDQLAKQQELVDEKKLALAKIQDNQSPAFINAQRDLEEAQSVLDSYSIRLRGGSDTLSLVSIGSRAEAPTDPTHPNKSMAYYLTLFVAISAGLLVASFVEIIFLFLRAAVRMDN